MAHGEPVEGEVAQLGVGFADKFNREAKDCVEDAKDRKVSSFLVRWKFTSHNKHNCKEDQTFEDCFVELGWMPWHIACKASEVNRSRQIARRTSKFAVDEVRATAEEKADRNTNKCEVQQAQVFDSHNFSAKETANNAADKTSVEAHAAFVDCKNFQWVSSIISVTVENNVAQPRPYDNSSDATQNASKDFVSLDVNFPSPGNKHQNNAGAGKT